MTQGLRCVTVLLFVLKEVVLASKGTVPFSLTRKLGQSLLLPPKTGISSQADSLLESAPMKVAAIGKEASGGSDFLRGQSERRSG